MEPKDLKWQMSIPCRVPGGVPWSLLFVTFLRLFTFILLSQWFLNLCVTRNPYWWAGGAWEFAFLARPGVGGVGSWCSWSGHPSVRTCALPGSIFYSSWSISHFPWRCLNIQSIPILSFCYPFSSCSLVGSKVDVQKGKLIVYFCVCSPG